MSRTSGFLVLARVVVIGTATLLAACERPRMEDAAVRTVRTIVASADATRLQVTYAGEIRPRFESNLGFRVSGKVLGRRVNVGDRVTKGQLLMRLDVQDLALNEAASRANVTAQEAQFAVERADFERYAKLAATGYLSRTEFDRQKTRFQAAQAQLDAVRAQARVSGNQTGYAMLRAEVDGTVTGIEAEEGQVVAAGATVVRIARDGEMEVASNIPEQQVKALQPGQDIEVMLWASGARRYPGRLRELSSSADPATRTYALRVSIASPPPEMKLGMTASIVIPGLERQAMIRIPLTAYVQRESRSGVWVFDEAKGTVNFRPVEAVGVEGNEALMGSGITPGEFIVTAGANLLEPGQVVRRLETSGSDG